MKETPIFFFKEEVSFRLLKHKEIVKWLTSVLKKDGCRPANINFIFCKDSYLRKLNKKHLNHDYNTDIITFDNSFLNNEIEGDIFISIDRVKANAKLYSASFYDELHRVMVHGILHLLDYSDKNKSEKAEMRRMEDYWLSKRGF
jgi:rRNA maturation RNase YbeY